ncbi:MAG: zf-HC2 domain-containing protein [Ruminococcus sp.]|nr:zf-HC2 domain-containing protein [Ruminococcus sp.]
MSENKRNETTKPTGLRCEIVRDLLPLYHDDVVSEVTKLEIKRHLADCAECSAELEALNRELPQDKHMDGSPAKQFRQFFARLRKKRVIITALVSLASAAAAFGGLYFATSVPIRQIPADAIHVHKVYRYDFETLPNGSEEESSGYFVYFSIDAKYMSGGASANTRKTDDGGLELVYKCPLIVWDRTDDPKGSVLADAQLWGAQDDDSFFAINGRKVWNAEEGNDGEVPGYVHDEYLYEFDSGSYGPDAANESMIYRVDESGRLGETFVFSIGGNVRAWSLDGELLFEGTEKEWTALNKKQ